MQKTHVLALGAMFLLPYLVSVDGDSTIPPDTFVEFAIGKGLYADVTRGCNGEILSVDKRHFYDVGGKVVHKISVLKLEAGAGLTNGDEGILEQNNQGWPETYVGRPTAYFDGTFGLDTKYFGLDLGGLAMFRQPQTVVLPAGSLRLGSYSSLFISLGIAQNTPLLAGSSLFDVGVGLNLGKANSILWFGLGEYPYDSDKGIFAVKLDVPLSSDFILQPRAGLGLGNFGEYSFSLGIRKYF